MATVKTAISIQASLFERVNGLVRELQMPRSQLFALAMEEFIKQHENRKMLARLDEVYADGPDREGEALQERMRLQQRQLLEGQQ